MLYSLSRKEGWRRYVDAPARRRPEPLTAGQLAALGGNAREDYDEARHDWHANFGILRTPQLAAVHDELELIVAAGRCDPDRVRGAAVIDALPGLGKTTAVNSFARGFDRDQIRRRGPLTSEGHERIPVFRVGLTSNTTLRTLNRMICQFYGHPGAGRASAAQLASQAVDCVLSCESRVGIIDEIHNLNHGTPAGEDLSDHLKYFTEHLPATFIYAGIDVERCGVFTGTRGRQLAGRCELICTGAFPYRDEWTQLIAALEATLRLHRHEPGTLPAQAKYLHQRTGGMIGSLTHLIRGAAIRAILSGQEEITRPLLDTVRIDHAAESATRRTSSTR
jgi:hypothetical protein